MEVKKNQIPEGKTAEHILEVVADRKKLNAGIAPIYVAFDTADNNYKYEAEYLLDLFAEREANRKKDFSIDKPQEGEVVLCWQNISFGKHSDALVAKYVDGRFECANFFGDNWFQYSKKDHDLPPLFTSPRYYHNVTHWAKLS